jgi:hypothetical protein
MHKPGLKEDADQRQHPETKTDDHNRPDKTIKGTHIPERAVQLFLVVVLESQLHFDGELVEEKTGKEIEKGQP